MEPITLVKTIVTALDDKKAKDIKVLDIHAQTGIADYFIICTGNSNTQTKALADFAEVQVEEKHQTAVLRREGYQAGAWVLLDYGSVVVQIFQPEEREYYNLEKLWGESPVVPTEQFLEV